MIKNIIFDFGNVIYNVRYENIADLLVRLGAPQLADVYTKDYQTPQISQFECGMITPAEFRDYLRQMAAETLPACRKAGVSDRQLDNIINSMLLGLPPHRVEMLKKVRRHYRLFLFSNTNQIHYDYFQRQIIRTYGRDVLDDIMQRCYYSHQIHTRKPSREGFDMIVAENRLDPAETLFIDDLLRNALAAEKAGLLSHHLTEPDLTDIFTPDGLLTLP